MKKKILLVDDEIALIKMVKLNLERTGKYEVYTEHSGPKAVEAAKQFKPDIIFLDIMMPGMSGDAIAHELQQDEKLAAIPIVFLTAIVSKDETNEWGSVIGGNRFLAKPVKTEEMLKVIAEIVG
jgi:CheY-like chemotaxis protein